MKQVAEHFCKHTSEVTQNLPEDEPDFRQTSVSELIPDAAELSPSASPESDVPPSSQALPTRRNRRWPESQVAKLAKYQGGNALKHVERNSCFILRGNKPNERIRHTANESKSRTPKSERSGRKKKSGEKSRKRTQKSERRSGRKKKSGEKSRTQKSERRSGRRKKSGEKSKKKEHKKAKEEAVSGSRREV